MSDDPDLRSQLRPAGLAAGPFVANKTRQEGLSIGVCDDNTGLRPPEIEETQQAARVAFPSWRMLSRRRVCWAHSRKARSELPRAG